MPSPRVFLIAGVALLAIVASAAVPVLLAAAIAADLALLGAFLLDLVRARGTVLLARRTWPPMLVQGAPAAVELRLRSDRAVTVRLRDALDAALADAPVRREIALPEGVEALWRYEIVPRRRGEPIAGPVVARVLGPWGLAWSQREAVAPEPRKVYPQVRWKGAVGRVLALARRRQLGQTPLRVRGLGSEIYGLRQYQPGDPPSRIQWKATARHGRLITREETTERGGRLVILLDCARAMATFERGRSKLDHALAAALALGRVAAAHGDRVTVIAFSSRVERVVALRAGARAVAEAYRSLFDVEARLVEPDYEAAAEAVGKVESRQATVVLLTSVVDLAAVGALREALARLARRHRAVFVNLEDPELAALARRPPADVAQAFAKVSALEILLGNRRLARRLRRTGIRVVHASADQLAWGAIEAWMATRSGRPVAVEAAR